MSENIDALQLAAFDLEFADGLIAKQDSDNNEVWFKYVAKGKAFRRVQEKLEAGLGKGALDGWAAFRRLEESAFSLASHPSHIGGVASLLPHLGDATADGWLDERAVSSSSLRTLSYSATRAFEYLANDLVCFNRVDQWIANLPGQHKGVEFVGLGRAAAGGRTAAVNLMGYLIDHWGDYDPDIDLSELENLQAGRA